MNPNGLCQNCNVKPAEMLFAKNENGKTYHKNLCLNCARELGLVNNQQPLNLGNGFGDLLSNLLEQFSDLNRGYSDDSYDANPIHNTAVKSRTKRRKSILDDFSIDLSELAENNKIDPVIGRNDEIEHVIRILNRRTKNNPVLIGEPGVGKTAIAEGLALAIYEGNVPDKLKAKRVISLNMSSVVAGTMYRGQFEDRMKKIVNELRNNPDYIVFIDELHTIMGAGSSLESKMDAANILKPFLSRGELQIVGATTMEEYRNIEKDKALERRFQIVKVDEPSVEDTVLILKGLRKKYEDYHKIHLSDEVLTTAVKLADRYVTDRFMPDKAIDLIDEVGARLNLLNSKPSNLSSVEQALYFKQKEKEAAELEDYQTAMECRTELLNLKNDLTVEELGEFELALKEFEEGKRTINIHTSNEVKEVTVSDIEFVVSKMTGIPVSKVTTEDKKSLLGLEDRLSSNVIGQERAVKEVSLAVKRHRINIRKSNKPATFFFTGPTGVGKTELTKQLAIELFGDKDAVIRFDMSEFMESHSVSKLIGSPPGYVGHEEAGQLTEKVRRKPYSIILLDEFEKAHSKVSNLFLQVFDEGRLTDSHGRTVDFSNTIIIMTSNLGTSTGKSTGFLSDDKTKFISAVESHFPKEFINRIDAIIPFKHLEKQDTLQILDLMLKELMNGLQEKNISLELSASAKDFLVNKGYSEVFGARPMYRTIIENLDNKITDILLSNDTVSQITVDVNEENTELNFNVL